ncbi:hypothetical protein [Nocardiopsis sp. MG754419]|uniref:hypothetical protein n=1 Tax=Nocardiopsis sp. MG754419 TaxID=2259865 RepID=UPI002012B569|nr:hypothetical protein [Nocardiopsis sp. MG754419]
MDGEMRVEEATDEYGLDYLSVVTEFTIVQPVARPGRPVSTRMVVSHLGEVGFFDTGGERWEAWPLWERAVAPAHCVEGHYFTPFFGDEAPEGERPKGPELDAYDLDDARDMEECGAVGDT